MQKLKHIIYSMTLNSSAFSHDLNPGNITDSTNVFHPLYQNNLARQNSTNNTLVESRSDESWTTPTIYPLLVDDACLLMQTNHVGAPSFHVTVSFYAF